jgi:hypothetical protein
MKRRVFFTVLALVVAFELGGEMAYAQNISAEIGFPFVAGGKEMASGKYTVRVTEDRERMVVLMGPGGLQVIMPVITTLGRHDQDPDAEFVFDKVDGKAVLSEVWMPRKDGLLLVASKGRHEHAVVGGSNPKK